MRQDCVYLESCCVLPAAHPHQPLPLQLHQVQPEVVPDAPLSDADSEGSLVTTTPTPHLVKLDGPGQPLHLHHLHVVHQAVAVLPRGLGVAVEGGHHDLDNI